MVVQEVDTGPPPIQIVATGMRDREAPGIRRGAVNPAATGERGATTAVVPAEVVTGAAALP
jgi:hypothetical protein